jgi:DNA-binding NarL/FixJ family response regulator
MDTQIRLAIVDDKLINRITIKEKLQGYTEIVITLESANGQLFLESLKKAEILPNLVLMDLEMPEMDGIETISRATAAYPDMKFIVLTVFEDSNKIFEAIKAGASGYLLKEDTAVNIVDAITSVYEHNAIPMSPAIARKAMDMMMKGNEHGFSEIDGENDASNLSKRELEVLKELASGKNYKFVGEKLFISPQTVRKHVTHIYEKLHVNSRIQALSIAQKKKWI